MIEFFTDNLLIEKKFMILIMKIPETITPEIIFRKST